MSLIVSFLGKNDEIFSHSEIDLFYNINALLVLILFSLSIEANDDELSVASVVNAEDDADDTVGNVTFKTLDEMRSVSV